MAVTGVRCIGVLAILVFIGCLARPAQAAPADSKTATVTVEAAGPGMPDAKAPSPFLPEESKDTVVVPGVAQIQAGDPGDSCCSSCCEDSGCGSCPCGLAGRFWMRADYLLWWTKGSQLPPLVSTSPSTVPVPGALAPEDETTVLFGGSRVNDRARSGASIDFGMWLDCCNTWGIEGNYFTLGSQTTSYDATSNGNPVLARPFFDTFLGAPNAELVAFPSVIVGRVNASASDYFQSAGLDVRHQLCCWECCNGCDPCSLRGFELDVISGYTYYNLSDNVNIEENLFTVGPPATPGTRIDVRDSFRARNNFNGTDIGLKGLARRGRWSLGFTAKASIGWNHEVVDVDGSTVVTSPTGEVNRLNGGLLALGTNSGSYSRDPFVVIPQLELELGYQLTCHLRCFVGYDFLYWGTVARSADQINLNIDSRNIPLSGSTGGGADPTFTFNQSSFWAQGIRLGAELRF